MQNFIKKCVNNEKFCLQTYILTQTLTNIFTYKYTLPLRKETKYFDLKKINSVLTLTPEENSFKLNETLKKNK